MSKTTLILILTISQILLATKTGAEEQKKSAISLSLESSHSFLKKSVNEFQDLNLSMKEFFKRVTDRFSDFFRTSLSHSTSDPDHVTLANLFRPRYYVDQLEGRLSNFDEKGFLESLETLTTSGLPNFQVFVEQNHNSIGKAKAAFIDSLRKAVTKAMESSVKNIGHQFVKKMKEHDDSTVGKTDDTFVIVEYSDAEKGALKAIYNQLKAEDKEGKAIFSDKEKQEFHDFIQKARKEFSSAKKQEIQNLYRTIMKRDDVLNKMARFSVAKAADLLRSHKYEEELGQSLTERFRTAVKAIVSLQTEKDSLELVDLLNFLVTKEPFFIAEIDQDNVEVFNTFLQNIFKAFLGDVSEKVTKGLRLNWISSIINSNNSKITNDEGIKNLFLNYYNQFGFPTSFGNREEEEINRRLIANDLLTYLPEEKFTEKNLKDAIDNLEKLKAVKNYQKTLFSKTKVFFLKSNNGQDLFSSDNQFFLELYRLTASFVESVSEADDQDFRTLNLFDLYLKSVYEGQSASDYFKDNYLVFKLFCLFFVPQTAEFETTFPVFNHQDIMAVHVSNALENDPEFRKGYQNAFIRLKRQNLKDRRTPADVSDFLSGLLTPAKNFNYVNVEYGQVEESKPVNHQRKAPVFQVKLVRDKNKRESNPKERDSEPKVEESPHKPQEDEVKHVETEGLNLVYEEVGDLGKLKLEKLKRMSVLQFIESHPLLEETDSEVHTYQFFVVKDKNDPCQK
jgi:hypothetical protein